MREPGEFSFRKTNELRWGWELSIREGPSLSPSLQVLQASLGLHQHPLGPADAREVSEQAGDSPPCSVPHIPILPIPPLVTHPSPSLSRRACEALRSPGALERESWRKG